MNAAAKRSGPGCLGWLVILVVTAFVVTTALRWLGIADVGLTGSADSQGAALGAVGLADEVTDQIGARLENEQQDKVVACDRPHVAEVVSIVDLSLSVDELPPDDELDRRAAAT